MEIRELRKAAGLTQSQFAEKIGVSQATVAEWERGDYFPSAQRLPAIAAALGCTLEDLFRTDTA